MKAVALLLAATAAAQVVPPEALKVEGNAIEGRLGEDQLRFVQCLGPGLLKARTITAISLRRDGQALPKKTLRAQWWHGMNAHDYAVHLGKLDQSTRQTGRFPLPTQVVRVFGRKLQLPDLAPVVNPPATFVIRFPLQRPYGYDGKGLTIDVHVSGVPWNDRIPYYLDAVRRSKGGTRAYAYGAGTGRLRSWVTAGTNVSLHLFGAAAYAPVAAILGTRKLPGPLLATPDVLIPVIAFSSGSARVDLSWVPGARFFTQWAALGHGVELSRGFEVETGRAALDAWVIYGIGYLRGGRYGLVDRDVSLVWRFE
jgi:hypothetical protein